MAFTQEQALNLADHGAEAIADILDHRDAYTSDDVVMALRARSIRAARAQLEMSSRMAAYDND